MSSRKKPAGPSPEERAAKMLKARRKFKAVVRMVMANLFWLGDIDDTLGDNVMLNIQKLTRKKIKKSTLTTKEKLVLTKPKEERTEEDKHLIDRAIGGLKCFRRYPPNVKQQLAAVTYFVYIGPDRVVVRQDHAPSALYFILSGEAVVTVRSYDKMLKEWLEEEHGMVGPGTMFGEVALLHGISRTATITTTTDCELLMIKKDDFDIVLKETVWKAWEQITAIMNRFSYFKNWDTVTKRECSIISRTKSYIPDEIILGDDIGLTNFSYLITKGTCYIVEHLMVYVYEVNKMKKFKLHIPSNSSSTLLESEASNISRKLSAMGGSNSRKISGIKCQRSTLTSGERVNKVIKKRTSGKNKSGYIETHFIKVCELKEGAIFNIGENFERRRVCAQTNVNCLLIPRYWLVKMNKDNIWNRVQQFLNKTIPTTEKIYKEWVEEKKFMEYRKRLVRDLLAEKKVVNTNSIHNVPYSIRLKEGQNYEI